MLSVICLLFIGLQRMCRLFFNSTLCLTLFLSTLQSKKYSLFSFFFPPIQKCHRYKLLKVTGVTPSREATLGGITLLFKKEWTPWVAVAAA